MISASFNEDLTHSDSGAGIYIYIYILNCSLNCLLNLDAWWTPVSCLWDTFWTPFGSLLDAFEEPFGPPDAHVAQGVPKVICSMIFMISQLEKEVFWTYILMSF